MSCIGSDTAAKAKPSVELWHWSIIQLKSISSEKIMEMKAKEMPNPLTLLYSSTLQYKAYRREKF
jgi:hypothetical protein